MLKSINSLSSELLTLPLNTVKETCYGHFLTVTLTLSWSLSKDKGQMRVKLLIESCVFRVNSTQNCHPSLHVPWALWSLLKAKYTPKWTWMWYCLYYTGCLHRLCLHVFQSMLSVHTVIIFGLWGWWNCVTMSFTKNMDNGKYNVHFRLL